MEEKVCFKCGQILPLSDFYRHSQMADGHVNKCKECNKKDVQEDYKRKIVDPEWRLKERERSREKMRTARGNGKYLSIPPDKKRGSLKRYTDKYPEKKIARNKSQRLNPEPCVVCGSTENLEGHHEDYSKPEDITWLCRKHHYERHVEIRKQQLLDGR